VLPSAGSAAVRRYSWSDRRWPRPRPWPASWPGSRAAPRSCIFNQKNPLPDVAVFRLGPRAGRAAVTTRIRLADSQRITAVAELGDGSFWSGTADVIVTLAACVEG
jgi:hypothetical protein